MSYFVQLGRQAKRKIGEWRLPAEGIRAILHRMDELSEIPSRHLLRIDSAEHVLQSDVVYEDRGPPRRDCIITLSIRYGVDEATLTIVDCDRICGGEVD